LLGSDADLDCSSVIFEEVEMAYRMLIYIDFFSICLRYLFIYPPVKIVAGDCVSTSLFMEIGAFG
jgi:hypothetical protein